MNTIFKSSKNHWIILIAVQFILLTTQTYASDRDTAGIIYDMSRVSSKIFYSNQTLKKPTRYPKPAPLQLTEDELTVKLIEILETEQLTGGLAKNYLEVFFASTPNLDPICEKLIQLIPNLDLDSETALHYINILNQNKTQNIEAFQTETAQAENIGLYFNLLKKAIRILPNIYGIKRNLSQALDITYRTTVCDGRVLDCTAEPPSHITGSNQGIIRHVATELSLDHALLLDSIRFSLKIRKRRLNHPSTPDQGVFSVSSYSVWDYALAASNQKPVRALELLTVFGHDICCNHIPILKAEQKTSIAILNQFKPNFDSSDHLVREDMFFPGALPGTRIPESLLLKFKKLETEYKQLNNGQIRNYRAGYYHVYGGLLTANEILKENMGYKNGVKISTLIAESMGYAYKRYTLYDRMSSKAKKLWKAIGSSTQGLRFLNYSRFKKWDQIEFLKAKNELNTHAAFLELTRLQHRQGANFAFKIHQMNQ